MCFCGWGKSLSITPMMTVLYYYSGKFCGEFVDDWHPDAHRILMVLPKMPFYSCCFAFPMGPTLLGTLFGDMLVLFGASDPSSGTMKPVESPIIHYYQPWSTIIFSTTINHYYPLLSMIKPWNRAPGSEVSGFQELCGEWCLWRSPTTWPRNGCPLEKKSRPGARGGQKP